MKARLKALRLAWLAFCARLTARRYSEQEKAEITMRARDRL